ncbi:MAG: ABC transporter ATP-binding protein [Candidatus Bathyarchaeota archaeon]|nr:ABC transporter ATP-binding protein [Candidatus Bathyarchaeota archaeon]MDH5664035.1 ABC transporter ATP-binding protein [Candidatus Bathyarchaeota archaeon]
MSKEENENMASKSLESSNSFVTLRDVSKNYYNFKALDSVSFEIKEGEIFGYIGPNGAGKTTTMKILVGLISDFQGEVFIGGYQVPKQKEEIHKLLGYLPQNVAFQEWRTINHALKTFGKLSGLSNTEVESRIPEILDMLSLSDVRNKKISQLSGGMTQKVGLAQALLHDPELLVLDEPLGGLDPLSRHQLKDIVLDLKRKGTTIMFSSHILSDVQDVADRVSILSKGRIKQVGTLNELKSRLSPQDVIEVELAAVFEKWQNLKSIKNVKDVELPKPSKILITLDEGANTDQVTNEILQYLEKTGGRIRSIKPVLLSLDEIYLRYVEEDKNR